MLTQIRPRFCRAGYPTRPWLNSIIGIPSTSGGIGSLWDISWHKSVGRDSFWTPAHMLIYMCGVLAGIACGYLILSTTLAPETRSE